jgi:cytoskeleton protein RodZ
MTSQKELIPMRPGDILRYEREQKGLTLETASAQSRIRLSVLNAIESGETGEIPSVYLRGYIRNYARYLGVDPEDLEDHMQHVQGAQPEVQTVFTAGGNRGNSEKWLKASSYLAASVLIATLAWQFTHEAVRFSQGDPQISPSAGGDTESHLNASIESVEVLKQNGNLQAGTAAGQAWAAIGEQVDSEPLSAGHHSLAVATSADTWVEIFDSEGEQLEMDLIRAGSHRQYTGQGPFQVMIGRASAVELVMDGEAIDLGPHTRGNVARMTLGAEQTASQ